MTLKPDFWRGKALAELNSEEWEALCDGCGICCLYKVEDADSGEVHLTRIACHYLDLKESRCKSYPHRKQVMPTCVQLTPQNVPNLDWLPETCAYRRIAEQKPLPWWHYLISGDRQLVHSLGISTRGKVIPENKEYLKELEEHIIPKWWLEIQAVD